MRVRKSGYGKWKNRSERKNLRIIVVDCYRLPKEWGGGCEGAEKRPGMLQMAEPERRHTIVA
ncbi:hypothetical protein [Modicisalibacter xianhensis]|uniref:hypothetical protein n=1 Tax=Modicisalibacter xianhensis TaxID=442341 RepID=UPI00116015F5|nr:hypothetical protein [Halomonas xianhensis]